MDHSMMDHSQMDHDMPMDDMCSMNMLLSWDYHNLCLLSSSWHIKTLLQFIVSLLLVVVLCVGFEALRAKVTKKQREEKGIAISDEGIEDTNNNIQGNGWTKSVGYGLVVGYSYIIMLIFMSYNAWVMLAVVVGATLGHHIFHGEPRDTMACH
ncbi:Copper transport protein CTR2 Short=Copper transporter 2 [Cyberlindnera jadinii]|uniref:Copper transport protein n=1 Tax=Cyberlindnera jadinii (strain ATCC 18201 / CBS 1600 / BCRC 20928 / JCM 3617 / NBRC 0987 / NRRL Y-1542) TaxID=983966 RepID=A0A0H5BZ52_CYBJN|nr:Copper transport protein CTR2 Short=Copper transporter 2 [Cyberlindnera jadinii]